MERLPVSEYNFCNCERQRGHPRDIALRSDSFYEERSQDAASCAGVAVEQKEKAPFYLERE